MKKCVCWLGDSTQAPWASLGGAAKAQVWLRPPPRLGLGKAGLGYQAGLDSRNVEVVDPQVLCQT